MITRQTLVAVLKTPLLLAGAFTCQTALADDGHVHHGVAGGRAASGRTLNVPVQAPAPAHAVVHAVPGGSAPAPSNPPLTHGSVWPGSPGVQGRTLPPAVGGNPAYPGSHDGDHDHGGWGDRGEHHRLVGIGEVRHVDDDRWREGRWTHEWRGDRFGWWWVVGPNWYLYDGPVYPYPVVEQTLGVDVMYDEAAYGTAYPPPPISQAPSAEWYYCSNPHGYYPQVPSCNVDWQAVPATPPVGSAPTYWYYCEQPQGYYPYVDRCNVPWTRVTPTAERSASAPASRNAPPPTNQPDRFWYYCQHPQGYYPTVAECDSDWIPVPSHGP